MKKITIKDKNKDKKPEFVQTFKTFSSMFTIQNRNSQKRTFRKIELQEIEIPETGLKINITFYTPEFDAYELRTFLSMLGNINMDREKIEYIDIPSYLLSIVKEGDDDINQNNQDDNNNSVKDGKSVEKFVEKLKLRLSTENENYKRLMIYKSNWSDILSKIGLTYRSKNIEAVKDTLIFLQSSSIRIKVKNINENKTILDLVSNLLLLNADFNTENKKNNKVILVFNPLFYAVAFGKTVFKSTTNLEVFRKLFEKDANMTIVYYILCDKVNFGKEVEFTISDLEYACYGNLTKKKSTKSKRKKFLLKALDEIEKLSNGSFIIKVREDGKVKVKRVPDRENSSTYLEKRK
jgi:hypothetical protein